VRDLRLSTVGAVSAILTTLSFVTGGVLLNTSGVEDLVPETGREGVNWIADADGAGDLFFVGGGSSS
jgi:hypothetical protein